MKAAKEDASSSLPLPLVGSEAGACHAGLFGHS